MDKDFKTTFIPKKNLTANTGRKKRKKTQGIIGLLAILLFVTAAVSVIGVYLYKLRLTTLVQSRIQSINKAEKAFEPAAIIELKKLDIRLRAATELLENHVAVVDFFESFAETTLPDIQYAGISIDFSEEVPAVSTTGVARGYLPIAQQSDLFEENRYVQNPIFSDFSRTDVDRISFSLSFSLNPELLVYGRTLENIDLDDSDAQQNRELQEGVVIEDQSNVLPEGIPIEF